MEQVLWRRSLSEGCMVWECLGQACGAAGRASEDKGRVTAAGEHKQTAEEQRETWRPSCSEPVEEERRTTATCHVTHTDMEDAGSEQESMESEEQGAGCEVEVLLPGGKEGMLSVTMESGEQGAGCEVEVLPPGEKEGPLSVTMESGELGAGCEAEVLPPGGKEGTLSVEEQLDIHEPGMTSKEAGPSVNKQGSTADQSPDVDSPSGEEVGNGRVEGNSAVADGPQVVNTSTNAPLPVISSKKSHVCSVCSKVFVYASKLKSHMAIHSGDKPFKCDLCEKQFKFKYILNKHMNIHTGEKPYECSICGKAFSWSSSRASHIASAHPEESLECTICKKRFTDSADLDKHMTVSHSSKQNWVCTVCGRVFEWQSNLVRHSLTHTGEKPFQCEICHRKFALKFALERHIELVHFA